MRDHGRMRAYTCGTRGSAPVSAEACGIGRRLRCPPLLERAAGLSPVHASSGPATLVARLRVLSRGGAGADDDTIQQFRAGFSTVAAQPVAMAVILLCTLGSAVYGASTVLHVPLSVQLGTGASGYGYLLAGPGGNR
jgi:hypothetical protein